MKIAMIGAKGIPHPGGIEKVVGEVGPRLCARGHEVLAYVRPHYYSEDKQYRDSYKGMKLVLLPSIATKHLDAISHASLATLHGLMNGVDVFHYHSIGLSILSLLPRCFGRLVVVQSHGLDWTRIKWGRWARAFLRLSDYAAIYFPHATLVVADWLKANYEQRFNKPVITVHNGLVTPHLRDLDQTKKLGLQKNNYILFLNRIDRAKGCECLIQAYSKLDTDKKLVVAGDSNYDQDYIQHLKSIASQNVIFTGFATGELYDELMSNAFIYVQPSESEAFPQSLLEAMTYGNCTLSSDIPAHITLTDGEGFFFQSGNTDSLKSRLEKLLEDEQIVANAKSKVRERIKHLPTWEDIADQLDELYSSLYTSKNYRSKAG